MAPAPKRMAISVEINKNIARIAALHKLPGKSSFNASFSRPVCPVRPVRDVHLVPDDYHNYIYDDLVDHNSKKAMWQYAHCQRK